jgi:hypothetical protein
MPPFFTGPSNRSKAMKTRTFILAGTATLVLSIGSAAAGPCTTEIESFAKMLASKDAGSGPTSGPSGDTQAGTTPSPQHPPTAIMGQQTEGKAMSPADVRRQTEGQPTAAQQGTTGMAATSGDMSEASAALDRARALDKQGKEAECMDSLRQAKQLAGPK